MKNLNRSAVAALVAALLLVACSSFSTPEKRLVGRWQATGTVTTYPSIAWRPNPTNIQFEFFQDGSAVMNAKWQGSDWEQVHTGTFKTVDTSHVKLDFGTSWLDGDKPGIYEMAWDGVDHVTFRMGDKRLPLARLK